MHFKEGINEMKRIGLCAVFLCLGLSAAAQPKKGNLLANPGLESPAPFDWTYGSLATTRRVRTQPHSGRWCLYVKDISNSYAQANNRHLPVRPGQRYRAEAWVRVDPKLPALSTFDVQFYDAQDKYMTSRKVGETASTQWTRLSGEVTAPPRAAFASLRLLPAGPLPGKPVKNIGALHGACYADDFYFGAVGSVVAAPRLRPGATGDRSLVLWYTFDEDTGDLVRDLSGYGNDGKIVKGQYLDQADGRQGVMRFDGKESSLNCGNGDSLYFGGDMTFEMWVRLNQPIDTDAAFIFGYPGPPFFFGRYYQHTLMLRYNCGEGGGQAMRLPVERSLINDEWAHVAVVVEYPRCRFYRNGELVRDAYMPLPGILKMKNRPKYIGGSPYGGYCPMDLDEFRLYRRALAPAEIAAHAKGEKVPPLEDHELAVEPHWYEDQVVLRLSCKGAKYSGYRAEMGLLGGDYKQVVSPKTVFLKEAFPGCGRYVAEVSFPLSDLLGKSVDGVARILRADGTAVKIVYRHASLRKPDWVFTREGYSDEVLPPWSPVEAQAKPDDTVEVRVWGRRYVFGPATFPQQVETREAEVLASPVSLKGRADGKAIAWEDGDVALKEASKTAAVLEGTAESDPLAVRVNTRIEYDGYAVFDCDITARRNVSLEELTLDIPLKTKHATLCLGMYVFPKDPKIPMKCNYSGGVKGNLAFRFSPNVWLGDEERGLCWQAESDEYWRNSDRQRAIEILPRGEVTIFRAHLVDVPTRLAKGGALHYKFALLATPIKPVLRDSWDLRIVRSDPYGEDLSLPDRRVNGKPVLQYYREIGVRHLFTNVNDIWPYPMPVHAKFSRALRRLVDAVHAHGLMLHPYLLHLRYPVMAPEYDINGLHMSKLPLGTYTPGWGSGGTPLRPGYHGPVSRHYGADSQGTVDYCPKSMALQDAYIHSLARRLDEFGDDGVYLDGTGYVVPCRNALHGCGYRAPDGTIRETYPVFACREFMRRIYTVVKTRRPDGILDVHQSFGQNTASLAYADMLWTGEHWWHLRQTGAKFIPDELPLDMFRTEFMGYPVGVATEVLSYRLGSRMKVSAISLLHDVPVRVRTQETDYLRLFERLWRIRGETFRNAEKLFYWKNQDYVRVSPERCYATLLKDSKNGVLAFVTNLRREVQTVTVRFNLEKLGLAGRPLEVFDALTGKPVKMTSDGRVALRLGSVEWTYIWLRPKGTGRE